jgi:uncharacterized protein (TIGR00290 family)
MTGASALPGVRHRRVGDYAVNMKYACSWSGGKDSALALWRAHRAIGPADALLTMFTEDGERSRSHGLRRRVLSAQAIAMALPSIIGSASWETYTPVFVDLLRTMKRERGIEGVIFGDIDLEPHRDWCQRVCAVVGLECLHPLWSEPRADLVRECLDSGIEAVIVAVKADALPESTLGRMLDLSVLREFEINGIDPAGEQGEYHTLVVNGPMFQHGIAVRQGERVQRDGYWFLDLDVDSPD